jgi:hypothetical protein
VLFEEHRSLARCRDNPDPVGHHPPPIDEFEGGVVDLGVLLVGHYRQVLGVADYRVLWGPWHLPTDFKEAPLYLFPGYVRIPSVFVSQTARKPNALHPDPLELFPRMKALDNSVNSPGQAIGLGLGWFPGITLVGSSVSQHACTLQLRQRL